KKTIPIRSPSTSLKHGIHGLKRHFYWIVNSQKMAWRRSVITTIKINLSKWFSLHNLMVKNPHAPQTERRGPKQLSFGRKDQTPKEKWQMPCIKPALM